MVGGGCSDGLVEIDRVGQEGRNAGVGKRNKQVKEYLDSADNDDLNASKKKAADDGMGNLDSEV